MKTVKIVGAAVVFVEKTMTFKDHQEADEFLAECKLDAVVIENQIAEEDITGIQHINWASINSVVES